MIHYHGLPITPDHVAAEILKGGHALISFANPSQLSLAKMVCKSFVLDNGAFTAWKSGNPISDWMPYMGWAIESMSHPACDWIVIPDIIDGSERDNDQLLDWFVGVWSSYRKDAYHSCVPVWHMHESFLRLQMLADNFYRIAIGSSGEYSNPGNRKWWNRIIDALTHIQVDGKLPCKLHGLRMLAPSIFTKLPFSSADSSTIGRSIGIDKKWSGTYPPPTKASRGLVLRHRIEFHLSSDSLPSKEGIVQNELF